MDGQVLVLYFFLYEQVLKQKSCLKYQRLNLQNLFFLFYNILQLHKFIVTLDWFLKQFNVKVLLNDEQFGYVWRFQGQNFGQRIEKYFKNNRLRNTVILMWSDFKFLAYTIDIVTINSMIDNQLIVFNPPMVKLLQLCMI